MESIGVIIPPALALPPSAILMLIVMFHLHATIRSKEGPASRRRIRTANGWIMLAAIPLLVAGFSLIDHEANQFAWALTWLAAILLLLLTLALAMLDVANTMRLQMAHRRKVLDGLLAQREALFNQLRNTTAIKPSQSHRDH